nr:Chain E, Caprin-1(369-378) [Homo sapiens]7XHG_F Chain F, Caprin-1(369-378) [Homo sapiens]7XHG_G Chain G, Caprin-1(369-378) [Homo sapiens]
PYNFIQDSML